MQNFSSYIKSRMNESSLVLDEAFSVSPASVSGSNIIININGEPYTYSVPSVESALKSFNGLYKYSPGRALNWLKKNAKHIAGGKLKESLVNKTFDEIQTGDVGHMTAKDGVKSICKVLGKGLGIDGYNWLRKDLSIHLNLPTLLNTLASDFVSPKPENVSSENSNEYVAVKRIDGTYAILVLDKEINIKQYA